MEDKDKEKQEIQQYEEYKGIQPHERIITIEFCSNCEDHKMHTTHSQESYLNIARYFQRSILMRFSFIRVLLKPIDTEIIKDNKESFKLMNKSKNINDKFKPIRLGAFEIQMCVNANDIVLIHSKLNSNTWPSIDSVLDKILKYVPNMLFSIVLYDKDKKETSEQNIESERKLEEIPINIYQCKLDEINRIKEQYAEELEILLNPKGRMKMITTLKQLEKTNPSNKKEVRPFTPSFYQKYHYMHRRPSTVGSNSVSTSNNLNCNSKLDGNSSRFLDVRENEIYDVEKIRRKKGLLIRNEFTDHEGRVDNIIIPYDSYIIEIPECKNFSSVGSIMRMNYVANSSVDKYIGLSHQSKAYVTVYVSHSNNENEIITVSSADVQLIKRVNEHDNVTGDSDVRFQLKENRKIKGRYEVILPPGKHLLHISKNGLEELYKEVELVGGENTLNILVNELRQCSLKIRCVGFGVGSYHSLDNVYLKVCKIT